MRLVGRGFSILPPAAAWRQATSRGEATRRTGHDPRGGGALAAAQSSADASRLLSRNASPSSRKPARTFGTRSR